MENLPILKRFIVETPLGSVHLVSFDKTGVNHREVILAVLSDVSGRRLALNDIVQTEEHPRPEIPVLDFDVNWTHSGDVCVLAYADKGVNVGVDFEMHKPNRMRIAERFYSAEEVSHLKDLDENRAVTEFFRLWCRKEALFKCAGGTFFEGAVRRSVLETPLVLEQSRIVHLCDVDEPVGEAKASLCVAVCK